VARGNRTGIAVVALLALTASARASTLDIFGFGGRSPGLAGTGVATADDYDATFLNPAGLAGAHRKRATLGLLYGSFDLVLAGQRTATAPARGSVIGGVVPMPLGGALKDRVGLGFGFYVPLDTLNKASAPFPGEPSFALLATRSQVIAIQVAVGVRVRAHLAIGVGVIALAALRGNIDVTTDAAGRFTTFSEERLVTQFAPVVGVRQALPAHDLILGATFRAPSRSDYDIAVTTDLGDAIPLTLPPIRIAGNAQYDPLTVATEAAWRARPDLLASLQLQYQRWSAFPLPTQNAVAGAAPQAPPGFHDTVVPRLSLEYTRAIGPTTLAGRVGYAFLWSPAPEMRGRQSLLDNNRHLAALGLGWTDRRSPVRIDVWVQAQYLQFRRHTKDAGLFEPGDALPFMTISTRGHVFATGVTVGVDL
jgi:long-chain fatty acid transport protein